MGGAGRRGRAAATGCHGVAELRGLARLRDEGVITDEEFTAKKRRVLGI